MIKIAINILVHPVTYVKWSAQNLPDGLNINENTGEISGTPIKTGEFESTIICENNWGATPVKKKFIINEPRYPKITSESEYIGYTTEDITLKLNTVNCTIDNEITNVEFSAQDLPDGLSINEDTGIISGTFTIAKIYNVTINVTNNFGNASCTFRYKINDIKILYPKFLERDFEARNIYLNTSDSLQLNCENSKIENKITSVNFSAQDLPNGLSINKDTGKIYGTPTFPNYKTINNHSYKLFKISKTWSEAKEYCELLGGHLAYPTSQEIINELLTISENNNIWLGIINDENSWKYINNEEATYFNEIEINNNENKDIYKYSSSLYTTIYNTNDNNINAFFICEWDYIMDESQYKKIIKILQLDDTYKIFNNHVYKLFTEKKTWQQAKEYCESLGGHLVVILNEETNEFIKNNIYQSTSTQYAWIGGYKYTSASDKGTTSSTWKWVTDDKMNYTNFNTSATNGGGIGMHLYINNSWGDYDENKTLVFICEWDELLTQEIEIYNKKIIDSFNSSITCTNNYGSDTITIPYNLYYMRPPYFLNELCKFGYYTSETSTSMINNSSGNQYLRLGPSSNVKNNIYKGAFYLPKIYTGGTFKLINNKFNVKYKMNNEYIDWYSCIANIEEVDTNNNNIYCTIKAKFEKFGNITLSGINNNDSSILQWPIIIRYQLNDEYVDFNIYISCVSGYDEDITKIEYSGEEEKSIILNIVKDDEPIEEKQINPNIPEDALYCEASNRYYKVITDKKTYEDAKIYCESIGGCLACPSTEEISNFINDLSKQTKNIGYYFIIGAYKKTTITDKGKTSETWGWLNNDNWEYNIFPTDEPHGTTNYLVLGNNYMKNGVKICIWCDMPYAQQHPFICEWEKYTT